MKSKRNIVAAISIIIITMVVLWFTGIIGLFLNGMSYIGNNTKEFNYTEGYLITDEYSFSINLNDLESNVGKEVYNDGESTISVSWIDNTGSSDTGGYRIGFRSCGTYTLNGATLVSGARHEQVDDTSFTTYMTAKMTAGYKDKVYESNVLGTNGLNYKEGDEFSFYIFPTEAYDNGEVGLKENGIVELSVKDFYKNIWARN